VVLLLALLALSTTLWGAASYLSPSALALGCTVIGCWLLVFAVRERIARTRRRTDLEG
jgi:hypothetical protein